MKVLFLSQYFHPETGANADRVLSFARTFSKMGHQVTVLCEFPNYPTGSLPKRYYFRLFEVEKSEGYKIVRTAVIPTRRSNVFSRLLNYAGFFISSVIIGLFLSRPHVIVATSPPPTVGLSAALLSIIKSTSLVGDIQDLWPEYAIAMGAINSKTTISVLTLIKKLFYRQCAAIITISDGLKKHLERELSGRKKVLVVHNGSAIADIPSFSERHVACFNGNVIKVCYAGQIGLCQPIEDILSAAELSIDDDSIRYIIVGDGVRRGELEKEANMKGLSNIVFTGVLPREETAKILLKSDVGVVTLYDIEEFKSALPTKFFDYMAAGLPVILGVDGEARGLLERYYTGLYYKPGSAEDLVDKIRWLHANSKSARAMGMAGKRLVLNSFSRSKLADKMEKIIVGFSAGL